MPWQCTNIFYPCLPARPDSSLAGRSDGRAEGLGLILRATGRAWSGREPAKLQACCCASHWMPTTAPMGDMCTATDPGRWSHLRWCVCVRGRDWENEKHGIWCVLWGGITIRQRWKEFLCKWANSFQWLFFAQADWWRKCFKNSNGMLHHILKLLRNVKTCDNVGGTQAAN